MAKEWILNSATNRFQLNFKRNVGATSEAIRKCAPKSLEEWQEYYFTNVRSQKHIVELGKKLYVKITEVLVAEIDAITEEDCINFIKEGYPSFEKDTLLIFVDIAIVRDQSITGESE